LRNPYNIVLSESCSACHFRREGFFCHFSAAELAAFDVLTRISAYPKDAILFIEQEKSRGIYVVCEGLVRVFLSSKEDRTFTLRIAGRGEVIGLLSVLTGNSYEVSAATLQPSQVAFVCGGDFRNFLRKYPVVFQRVARQLGSEYQAVCERARSSIDASASERVAQFLLYWSAEIGVPEDGVPFRLPSHEEIAEHVGVVRESVTRALADLRRRGLLQRYRSTFTIPDRAALKTLRKCAPSILRPAVSN
jgi:CRP/FNR family transcriptional regulator, cyclic AMP receptor protein